MKKTAISIAVLLMISLLAGCARQADPTQEPAKAQSTEETAASEEAQAEPEDTADAAEAEEVQEETKENSETSQTTVRVGSLKGPTTMGIVNLQNKSEEGATNQPYEFTMSAQPAEIASAIATGDLDIALLPANLAATLYQKTNGGVKAIDINTLGVLYCVTGDETVKSVKDLAGRTILTTGQGATPEYALRYLLNQYEISNCELEFKS